MLRAVLAAVGLVVVIASAPVYAQDAKDPEDTQANRRAAAEELIDATDAMRVSQQLSDGMLGPMMMIVRRSRPNAPQEFFDRLTAELKVSIAKIQPKLREMIVVAYVREFTLDELKAIAAFYRTPAGSKAISLMPTLMQEVMVKSRELGQQAAKEAAQRTIDYFRAKGRKQ